MSGKIKRLGIGFGYLLFFALYIFIPVQILSQTYLEHNPNVIHYSYSTGLPVPNFIDLEYDSLGQIWGLSTEGLFCYDGIVWRRIDAFGKMVEREMNFPEKIFIDTKGRVLLVPLSNTDQFLIWDGWNLRQINLPLQIRKITDLESDEQGNVWISTESDGIIKLDNDDKIHVNPFKPFSEAKIKRINDLSYFEGNLYLACDEVLLKYKPGSVYSDTVYYSSETSLRKICVNDEGDFFLFCSNLMNPSRKTKLKCRILFIRGDSSEVIYSSKQPIGTIELDRIGDLIIYLTGKEIFKWSWRERNIVDSYNHYLQTRQIKDLFIYRDNSYWIATSEGITVIRNPMFRIFPSRKVKKTFNGVFNPTPTQFYFRSTDGRLYRVTQLSSYRYNFDDITDKYKLDRDFRKPVTTFIESGKKLYLLEKRGSLYQLNQDGSYKKYSIKEGLPVFCMDLLKTPDNKLLAIGGYFETKVFHKKFGYSYPLAVLEGDKFVPYSIEGVQIEKTNVYFHSACFDKDGTLYLYDSVKPVQGVYIIKNRIVQDFISLDSLQTKHIYDMYCNDEGVLYLGVDGGVIVLKNGQVLYRLSASELGTGYIYDIFPDYDGYLWFVGKSLVNRFDTASHKIERFSFREGLFLNSIDNGYGLCDVLNRIWICTPDNVFIYDKKAAQYSAPAPKVGITEMLVNGIHHHFKSDDKLLDLGRKPGSVEISYKSVYLISPSDVYYRTKLEGLQKEWSAPTSKTSVLYANLPPGDYTFHVMAGLRNSEQTTILRNAVRFRVSRAFWETPLFFALAIIGVLMAVFSYPQFRLIQSKRREVKLEKLIKDRTGELLESEEKYSLIFKSSKDALVLIDTNFRILDYNPRFPEIFGFNENVINKNLRELVVPPEEKERIPQIITESPKYQFRKGVFRRLKANGESVWVDIDAERITLRGEINYIVKYTDVTREKILEEQQKAIKQRTELAEKMEAIGQFATEITHNFRNQMNAINLTAEMMKKPLQKLSEKLDIEDFESKLETIISACKVSTALINQILGFSREQEIELSSVSLNRVVTSTLHFIRAIIPANIKLNSKLSPDIPPIKANPNQLEQVLLNLASNSRDAMQRGGEIRIDTEKIIVKGDKINVNQPSEPGEYVCLRFSDNGCGMDEKTKKRIFEPFFTTKEVGKGTGLGLSSVYGTVMRHGGYIFCDSAPGKGTEFSLFFPVIELEEDLTSAGIADIRGGNETILVVDDDKYTRKIVSDTLSGYGYRILEAENGNQALQKLQNDDKIALILLDLNMPDMDGWAVWEKVVMNGTDIPGLFISGFLHQEDIDRIRQTEGLYYLEKPFRSTEIGLKVRSILDKTKMKKNNLF